MSPEALELITPTKLWRQLKATYAASNGDPAVRQAVRGMAGHIQQHLPELLELEPVPAGVESTAAVAIPEWYGGSSMDEPKGQCANCGDYEGQHASPTVAAFPAAPEGREWHNPQHLTPEQIGAGEGWRLLLTGEVRCVGDQWDSWPNSKKVAWSTLNTTSEHLTPLLPISRTHRTRRPLPAPQAEEPAPAAPAAKPLPPLGNPNCARVPFVDDKPAMEVVIAKRVTDSGFLDCVPAQVVAAIPESNGGGPTTAAGQAILAINSNSHDLDDGVFKTFEVNGQKVRCAKIDGRAAVMGVEFATAMGYSNPWDALKRHCKGLVKREVLTQGGPQEVVMIFAGDVNRLLVKSKLPSAQEFESLVFDTILPAIQETGGWAVPGSQMAVRDDRQSMLPALQDISSAMRAVADRVMIIDTQVDQVAGRVNVVETRQAETETRLARAESGLKALAYLQVDGERRMQARLGVPLPQLPAPAQPSTPGRVLDGEEYLSIEAYRRRFFPRGFKAGGLRFSSGWIGRAASTACRERGIAVPMREQIGVDYLVRCYPLSVLHDVANAHRRGTQGGGDGSPQMALAA